MIAPENKQALQETLDILNSATGKDMFYLEYRRNESIICLMTTNDDKLVVVYYKETDKYFYDSMIDYMRAMIKGIAIGINLMVQNR